MVLVPAYQGDEPFRGLAKSFVRRMMADMSTLYKAIVGPLMEQIRKVARPRIRPLEPGLGLALGGGFARGFAHIGVLEVLEANHIPISCITGTSVGSILGAAYASGIKAGELAQICHGIRFKDFARWRVSRMGLASNDRMQAIVERWFGGSSFEEMKIPLAVVATDLGTGEPVILTRGNLVDAVRASCAFPGLFEPVMIDGQCLADGGLVAPLPTRAAALLGASRVLAVDVGFNRWRGDAPTNLFQVICRSINAAQKHRNPSWERFADLVISPEVQEIEWDGFDHAEQAIAAGRAAMQGALTKVRELLHLAAGSEQGKSYRLQHDAA
jgi:NTE family protein